MPSGIPIQYTGAPISLWDTLPCFLLRTQYRNRYVRLALEGEVAMKNILQSLTLTLLVGLCGVQSVLAQWVGTHWYCGTARCLAVSGTNLFAGTYDGVYVSTNNGADWSEASAGLPPNSEVNVFAVNGINLFAGTYGAGVFLSTNSGSSWTVASAGLTNTSVWSLAVSDTNLFAGTHFGGVFRSTDNGTSWTAANAGLTDTNVWSLAINGTNLFAGTAGGGVFLSSNNGTSWTAVNNGLTNLRVEAFAVSGTNLWAGTDGGGVFLSMNNGANWTAVNSGLTNTNVPSLAVSGTNLFAGTWGCGVFHSNDNGTTWTDVSNGLPNSDMDIYGLAASGTNLFAALGIDGVWRRPESTSVHTGWFSPTATTDQLNTVFFLDTLNGWIGGANSVIKKTTDGGFTWTAQTLPVTSSIQRIKFLNSEIGFAVGSSGTILKTENAGQTWVHKSSGTRSELASICFLDSQEGWACGGSDVLHTTDQGETWSADSMSAIAHWDIAFRNSQEGWLVGLYGSCYETTDAGQNWNSISPPISGRSLFGVCFPSSSRGVLIGGEQIARSTDGGASWATVYNSGSQQLNSVSFADSSVGWVVGSHEIAKSTNGGNTWASQSWPYPQRYLVAVYCVDPLHAWAVGDQLILRTRDGGGVTGVAPFANGLPNDLILCQNFPNPFNPQTTLRFALPNRSRVVLSVFDVLGREVTRLINSELNAGEHTVVFDATALPSGIYVYRLATDEASISKKCLLLK
jgi:photosystem II stability/assembly factor-like uncharacterized protein